MNSQVVTLSSTKTTNHIYSKLILTLLFSLIQILKNNSFPHWFIKHQILHQVFLKDKIHNIMLKIAINSIMIYFIVKRQDFITIQKIKNILQSRLKKDKLLKLMEYSLKRLKVSADKFHKMPKSKHEQLIMIFNQFFFY